MALKNDEFGSKNGHIFCNSRYTKDNTPLSTYHGSTDGVISIAEEDGLIAGYKTTGVVYEQHELMGWGHGADAAAVREIAIVSTYFDRIW